MEAKGRFMVREFVEVAMLKMFPAVPVAMLVMTLLPKVIWVEVPINTFCPPEIFKPLPTVNEPKVLVPIPPEETPRTWPKDRLVMVVVARVEVPVTDWLPSTIKLPVVVALPEIRSEAADAGPLTLSAVPMLAVPVINSFPATTNLLPGVVVPIPTLAEALT